MTDWATSDAPTAVGEGRSTVGRAGLGTAQWCRKSQTRRGKPGQAQWDRGTHTRRSHPSHDDHWALEDDPDMDVRTVSEAVGVEERQDENRRCGDACDSLFHWDAQAVEGLAHRKPDPDTVLWASAWGILEEEEEAVGAGNEDRPPGVAGCPEVGHERRKSPAVPAEGKGRDHHVGVALAQQSSDVGMPYARARTLVSVKKLA